jgi:hypothetical protein
MLKWMAFLGLMFAYSFLQHIILVIRTFQINFSNDDKKN